MEYLLPLIGMLAAVVAILVLAYLATRWIASRGVGGGAAAGAGFCVLRQISLGRAERLLLVRLGERCLLLGVTAGGISLLKELEADEAEEWLKPKETPAAPGFLDVLKENLKKK